jgi:hypothetical protein
VKDAKTHLHGIERVCYFSSERGYYTERMRGINNNH